MELVDVNSNAFTGVFVKSLNYTEIYKDDKGHMHLVRNGKTTLPNFLRQCIEEHGGTQIAFAKDVGLSMSFIQSQLHNRKNPRTDTNLRKLAKYKGITLAELKERCNLD